MSRGVTEMCQEWAVVTAVQPDRLTEGPGTAWAFETGDLAVGEGRGDGAAIKRFASRGRQRPQVQPRTGRGQVWRGSTFPSSRLLEAMDCALRRAPAASPRLGGLTGTRPRPPWDDCAGINDGPPGSPLGSRPQLDAPDEPATVTVGPKRTPAVWLGESGSVGAGTSSGHISPPSPRAGNM